MDNNTNTAAVNLTGLDRFYVWVDAQCIGVETSISRILQGFLSFFTLTTTARTAAPQAQEIVTAPAMEFVATIPAGTTTATAARARSRTKSFSTLSLNIGNKPPIIIAILEGPNALIAFLEEARTRGPNHVKTLLEQYERQIASTILKKYRNYPPEGLLLDAQIVVDSGMIDKGMLYHGIFKRVFLHHLDKQAELGVEAYEKFLLKTAECFEDSQITAQLASPTIDTKALKFIYEIKAFRALLRNRSNPALVQNYLLISRRNSLRSVPLISNPSEAYVTESTRHYIITEIFPEILIKGEMSRDINVVNEFAPALAEFIKKGYISNDHVGKYFSNVWYAPFIVKIAQTMLPELFEVQERDAVFQATRLTVLSQLSEYKQCPSSSKLTSEQMIKWIEQGLVNASEIRNAVGVNLAEDIYKRVHYPGGCATTVEELRKLHERGSISLEEFKLQTTAHLIQARRQHPAAHPRQVWRRAKVLPEFKVIDYSEVVAAVRETALRMTPADATVCTLPMLKFGWVEYGVLSEPEIMN